MKLYQSLYNMIWLAFLAIISGLPPLVDILLPSLITSRHIPIIVFGHMLLGTYMIYLAYKNREEIQKTACPDRPKRIVRSTFQLVCAMPFLGIILTLTDNPKKCP